MKNRYSSFDLTAIATDLKKLVGLRCSNIYDINNKTYLLKFFGLEKQVFVLIESGIRIHTTNFKRDKAQIPSVFCFKLRKHIRTKKLNDVRQLGIDRVIDFVFGQGKSEQHLLVELYANGNILLTDADYKIQTLLRTYKVDDNFVATNRIYPTDTAKEMSLPDFQMTKDALNNCDEKDNLKKVLVSITVLSPEIVEHCILKSGFKPGRKPKSQPLNDEEIVKVLDGLKEGIEIMKNAIEKGCKGYITLKPFEAQSKSSKKKKKTKEEQINEEEANILKQIESHKKGETKEDNQKDLPNNSSETNLVISENNPQSKSPEKMYEQFLPFVFEQYKSKEMIEYDSFMQACDVFFTEIENQKQQQQSIERDKKINSKVEKVKKAHNSKIEALDNKTKLNTMKAELIEYNVEDVEKAITIIKSGIENKLDWSELKRLVKENKKEGNYIASLIHSLNFEKNTITLLLAPKLYECEDDNEEENERILSQPPIQVEIDFTISAYQNAEKFYQFSKTAQSKKEKTLNMAGLAIKQAEKTAERTSKDIKVGKEIKELRKTFWFEKFYWFITTENYLVIAGRDAQQNELIVKRYMEKNDVYVHAEVHGAASCVIKNYSSNPISPISLEQAGYYCVCRSKAWQSKTIASAYWVHPDQVSKTAPTGEYLSTGSFMIRGKKNFLEPTNLIMGLGIMFYLDDESWSSNHKGERSIKVQLDENTYPAPEGDDGEDDEETTERFLIDTTEDTEEQPKTEIIEQNKPQKKSDKNSEKKNKIVQKKEDQEDDGKENKEEEEEDVEEETNTGNIHSSQQLNNQLLSSYTLKLGEEEEEKGKEDQQDDEEEEDNNEDEDSKNKKGAKKKLSRAQRKQLKQAQKNPQYDPQKEKLKNQPKGKKSSENTQPKRGQRKKKNKRHNDDEDDLIAKKVLGIKVEQKPQPSHQEEEQEEGQDDQQLEHDSQYQAEGEGEEYQGEGEGEAEGEGEGEYQEGEGEGEEGEEGEGEGLEDEKQDVDEKQSQKPNLERRERREKERQELALISEQEKISIVSDVIKSQNEQIDKLTGMPKKEDNLLFAIPMCAPYHALQNFKYKVKLTPGKTTRGTARKNAINYFLKQENASDRERDLIKHIDDGQVTSSILGEVTVNFPLVVGTNNKKKSNIKKRKNKKK